MGNSNIIVGEPFDLCLDRSTQLFTKCDAEEVGVQVGNFGATEVICNLNLIGNGYKGVILFGNTYCVKPLLKLDGAVLKPSLKGGMEEGAKFSGDEELVIGIGLRNSHS